MESYCRLKTRPGPTRRPPATLFDAPPCTEARLSPVGTDCRQYDLLSGWRLRTTASDTTTYTVAIFLLWHAGASSACRWRSWPSAGFWVPCPRPERSVERTKTRRSISSEAFQSQAAHISATSVNRGRLPAQQSSTQGLLISSAFLFLSPGLVTALQRLRGCHVLTISTQLDF